MSDQVNKGDRYIDDRFGGKLYIEVLRVAKDGSWADIKVEQISGATWTKRQPTPIPGKKVS